MDRYGIAKAVVSCFTPKDLDFRKANKYIKEVVSYDPKKRFSGAAVVDPRLKDNSIAILKESLGSGKFSAIMLNPFEQSFKVDDERFLFPIMVHAEKFDVPVIIEAGYPIVSTALQVALLASRYPKIPIIMTHAGQLLASGQAESDALRAMLDNSNIFAETSLLALSGLGGFIRQSSHLMSNQNEVGSGLLYTKLKTNNRIIFGSESPLSDPGVEIERVLAAKVSESEKRFIFHDVANALFKF
jgi:predicted TIM-barrel fold metal-dependent hydrolase